MSRFEQRRREGRVSSARPLLLVVGAVALAAVLGWAVLFSTLLSVDTVRVQGEHAISQQAVVKAAAIDPDTPLARVNLDDVQQRIEALPGVDHATVHRSWPHTITITVAERQPIAAVHRRGGWQAMDKDGVIFPTGQRGKPNGLPVVEIQPDSGDAAQREVASVVRSLPADIITNLRRLKAASMDSIVLVLRDGRQVVWGNSEQSARKAAVLQVLLEQPAQVYDVSVPEQPTTAS